MFDCNLCGLGAKVRGTRSNTHFIMGEGSKKAKVMFVAEAPDAQDTAIGTTFTGQYGMLLNEMIEKAGYVESDTYKTTLVKCKPTGGKSKIDEIMACKNYLEEEINKIKPDVIVPLGAVVVKYFLGQKKISDVRGYVFDRFNPTKEYAPYIIPTYSLQAILGRPTNLFEVQADIKRAFEVADKGYNPMKRTYSYSTQPGAVYKILQKCDAFAFDVETTGLDHYQDRVITCSFSIMAGQSVCLSFDQYWFEKIFALPCKKIAHSKFDSKILKCSHGITTTNFYFDTMAAIQLLNDNAGKGLKNLASLYTDVPYYNLESKVRLQDEDVNTVALYNNFDTDVTFRLWEIFARELVAQELDDLFFDTTMPVNLMLLEIEEEGIDIDIKQLKNLSIDKNIEALEIKGKLDDIKPINWNSPKQVGVVLFDELGLECPIKTPTGGNSTNEKVLNILKNRHPAPQLLLNLRSLNKGLSTYLAGVYDTKKMKPPKHISKDQHEKWKLVNAQLELLDYKKDLDSYEIEETDLFRLLQDDGRIHNDNNINGTVSGRLTSPLHTIPREGGYRDVFVPGPNYKFVGMDYKQFELRIAAFLAGETQLLAILDSPGCKEILTKLITGQEYTEEFWVQTKSIIYGTLYGMGPKRSSVELGISEDYAQDLRESFFRNFKKVKRLLGFYKRDSLSRGYIEDMVGRRRRFLTKNYKVFEMDGDIIRQAINFPIQAGSSALFWPKVLEVHEYLRKYKSKVIHTKHDAVYFKIHTDEMVLVEKLKNILEKDTLIGDVLVDVKIGDNWGEC
jgi:DNA polymerase-1